MTNGEAIHELECNVDYKTPQIAQACKLAVRALETQRPKGNWILIDVPRYKHQCSKCGFEIQEHISNYCPKCGADMKWD